MYATLADVRLALAPQSADPSQPSTDLTTAASLSNEQLTDSILEAMSTVDTYIGSMATWDRTIEPAREPIRWLTRDIAAYLAALVYRRGKDLADTDPIVRRYNHAMRTLTAIAAGTITVLPDPNTPVEGGGDAEAYNLYEGRLFGPEDQGLAYDGQQVTRRFSIWPGN